MAPSVTTNGNAITESASTSTFSSKVLLPASGLPANPRLISLFTHTSQHNAYHYISLPKPTSPPTDLQLDSASASLLQTYYLSRLPLLARAFGFHERLLATAMSYFKRFWLPLTTRHVAQPFQGAKGRALKGGKGVKVVMLICLFLATKTHSTSISLSQFSTRVTPSSPGSTSEQRQAAIAETSASILDNEFEVASVLGWRFRVTHAFEGARGIAIDLQRLAGAPSDDRGGESKGESRTSTVGDSLTSTLLDRLRPELDTASQQLRLTEAEFLYAPSHLALGTWWSLVGDDQSSQTLSLALTTEEQGIVRRLLCLWINEKEQLLFEPPSASLPSSDRPVPLLDIAAKVAAYVRQGASLQEELRSPGCVEKVKAIDLVLREWAEQQMDKDVAVDIVDEDDEAEEDRQSVVGATSTPGGKRKSSVPKDEDVHGREDKNPFLDANTESVQGNDNPKKRIKMVR